MLRNPEEHLRTVRRLLDAGADVKAEVNTLTPLHMATGLIAMEREGLTGSFEERAKKATDVFLQILPLFSPDFPSVVRLLFEAGADADTRCVKISDELVGFSGGDKEVFKQLEGKTPLEFARILGNEAVVKYLEAFKTAP